MSSPPGIRKRLQYRFEYALLRCSEGAASHLPRPLLLAFGAGLGAFAHRLGYYRRIVDKNFEIAGFSDPVETARIRAELYRNMGRYAMDLLRASAALPPYVLENSHVLEAVRPGGPGAVALLAHLGNWELLAAIFGKRITPLTVVGKPMKNPYVHRWIFEMRRRAGVDIIFPKQALRRCLRTVRAGGIAGFLIDQYAGSMGAPARFMGRETSTVRTPAGIVEKTGCAALGAYALLEANGRYRVVFENAPAKTGAPPGSAPRTVAELQQAYNDLIEGWIRAYPEHWFGWFHRRFKDSVEY